MGSTPPDSKKARTESCGPILCVSRRNEIVGKKLGLKLSNHFREGVRHGTTSFVSFGQTRRQDETGKEVKLV